MLIGALCLFAVGASLGWLGAGGTAIALPALVYVVGLAPHRAVALSLLLVGGASVFGDALHHPQRTGAVAGGGGVHARGHRGRAAGLARQLPVERPRIAARIQRAAGRNRLADSARARLSHKTDPARLKRYFAFLLLGPAAFMAAQNLAG